MMRKIACAVVAVLLMSGIAAAQPLQKDDPACKDHPLFTRMPDSWIRGCSEKAFDAHAFATSAKDKTTVEGRLWQYSYYPQASAKSKPSELQILRNFENAVTRLGGKVVYSTKTRDTLQLVQDGREIWVDVWAEFTGKYGFFIVEKQAMTQDIVASAAVLSNDLKSAGHVAVGGVLFDTGKAEIKAESAQAIGEIAKLLNGDPALKVFVVGHTDNVGALDVNMKLSQDRAEAVAQALVRTHGIGAARLKSFGNGPYAPVASNESDAGRARNRRVELVKQ